MKVSITQNGNGTRSVSRNGGLAFEIHEVPEVVANLWFAVENRYDKMQDEIEDFLRFRKLPRTNPKHDCLTCGCMLKPTGEVTNSDFMPLIVHFTCESCGDSQQFFEEELK